MLKPTDHSAAASTCFTSFITQTNNLGPVKTSGGHVSVYSNVTISKLSCVVEFEFRLPTQQTQSCHPQTPDIDFTLAAGFASILDNYK